MRCRLILPPAGDSGEDSEAISRLSPEEEARLLDLADIALHNKQTGEKVIPHNLPFGGGKTLESGCNHNSRGVEKHYEHENPGGGR